MQLEQMVRLIPGARVAAGAPGVEVKGITYDSRRVEPGFVFFAIPGLVADGRAYVPDALARGAAAVFASREVPVAPGVALVLVEDPRQALALAASAFFGHPSRLLAMVGVTGTKGKTTTAYLIRALFESQGRPTGLIGTVQNVVGGQAEPVRHTTPEAPELQSLLSRMVAAGDVAAVAEVSSHALQLGRVAGTDFDFAVLTNVGHDHLDLHGTMENYVAAKARLFSGLGHSCLGSPKPSPGPLAAVTNGDDPASPRMRAATDPAVPFLTFGLGAACDVRAEQVVLGLGGASFLAATPWGRAGVRLGLEGRFNVYNALAALTVGLAAGFTLESSVRALGTVPGVPGRFERIDQGQGFLVLVDYAHTPDSLANVIAAAREVTKGRVLVVFGCGGDRDRTKRPVMGRLAAQMADVAILTSDNPRGEDPLEIIAEVEQGMNAAPAAQAQRYSLPDREEAIRLAVDLARPGDVVLIAGKGHETYQVFRDKTIHFDDREVARQALAALGFGGGRRP